MIIIEKIQNQEEINNLLNDQIANMNNNCDELLADQTEELNAQANEMLDDQQQEINEMIKLLED